MKEYLISVIIPVYGVEKYIGQCLESVINQTYTNLEIIVVNDGTKDRSSEIAKEYAKIDSRIKVYDFENGGLSVARNRGLELATGDYISYIDSDDWIDLKMYDTLLRIALRNDADMVKCGVIETDEVKNSEFNFSQYQVIVNDKHHNAFEYYFQGMLWTLVWNGLYKKELAKKIQFPVNVVHEDNYSSGMFLYFAKRIVSIPFCGNYYRINNLGISKGGIKRPLDKILAISKLKNDLDEFRFRDKKLDWKLSVEFYHFVRGWNETYNVVGMKKELYDYICENLDVRRRYSFKWICYKKRIKL